MTNSSPLRAAILPSRAGNKTQLITTACLFGFMPLLYAATSVSTTGAFNSDINGNLSTTSPHSRGNSSVTASFAPLAVQVIGNSLVYTGSSSIVASKSSGNNSNTFNSFTILTVMFSLSASETADIILTGDYSLMEIASMADSQLSWSLTGPTASNVFIPTIIYLPGSGSINQSASGVNGAGNYVLQLIGQVAGATTVNSTNLATAQFTNVEFTVSTIPEPSTFLLLGIVGLSMFKRTRRQA